LPTGDTELGFHENNVELARFISEREMLDDGGGSGTSKNDRCVSEGGFHQGVNELKERDREPDRAKQRRKVRSRNQ
jgi:hypothetical protein